MTDAGKTGDDPGNASTSDGGAVKILPESVLANLAGCWQLADRERWVIERTGNGGARVVRTLLQQRDEATKPDYAKRAALPADILYNTAEQTLAFSTAGPAHALLFVFTIDEQELQGTWAASHAPGSSYRWLAGRVTLHRCAAAQDSGASTR